jgi:predicted membrane-bound spermidine synthase/tetratricopeptide (TPR) repeat protein
LLYFFFFCSGISGLIYQVVWVRVFGNVFGNTVYSTALVVAVFMLGLGVGSYIVGAWADRRYTARPDSLLRAYAYCELAIAGMGVGISAILPHLGRVSALVSSYSREPSGWYVLSTTSYLARAGIAVVLLAPITLLMGGTLTLLIRYLVRSDLDVGGWRIAVLYAVNTAGAALGCLLTDFTLVPSVGLRGTQMAAVFFNVVAAVGALYLGSRANLARDGLKTVPYPRYRRDTSDGRGPRTNVVEDGLKTVPYPRYRRDTSDRRGPRTNVVGDGLQTVPPFGVPLTSLALAMSGFAAMGMEILWFRHFTILLGGFRAVFSLLLTVILIGIGAGSLAAGLVHRWPKPSTETVRAAQWLMVMQGLFVAFTLVGLATADARHIEQLVRADPAYQAAAGRAIDTTLTSGWMRGLTELWFNARPILLEVGIPALLMGFSFPLANAIVQRAAREVGRRAGILYLSNTVGAVCGSLAAGFLLLPRLGIQGSATVLMCAAAIAVVPLHLATRTSWRTLASSLGIGSGALGLWLLLPSDYVIVRALGPPAPNERLLARSEGLTEAISVTEVPGEKRTLATNGHRMSSTARLSQRYMRALAHIPLLSIDHPETALVIGFGVGNTTHAATLHPSIRRVEVADLSKGILLHGSYFTDANRNVLEDPRVVVYVNDGRHHLQMQSEGSYDLITLEPPPIAYAGVAALYSREFYALARTRLTPKGYVSQWLPAYQVPSATTLAMIRAFIEVFPQAVLVSGAEADLLLIGANEPRIEIDPARLTIALASAPEAHADLRRLDLGGVREIVGAFVGSARTLVEATRGSAPVSDDRPIQEYGVVSLLNFGEAVPASVVDLTQVAAWCPKCFVDGRPAPLADGLDTYLALLGRAYMASRAEVDRAASLSERERRVIAGSAYLGAIVPESAELHNSLGIAFARKGEFDTAIAEFRDALRLEPESAITHWHLGAALASRGARAEAIGALRRSVELDPNNGQARYDLATLLLGARQLADATDQFRATLRLLPNSVEAHTRLGIALALQGRLDEAIDQLQQALTLNPESADARRNLTIALGQRRSAKGGR